MRKKIISLALVMVLSISQALAGGFFPTTDEMFGVTMPSVSYATGLKPVDSETNESGFTERYEGFNPDAYDKLGKYVAAAGCTCENETVVGGVLVLAILKDDATFTLEYDFENNEATVFYPSNTRLEKSATVTTSNNASVFPDLGDVFGTELPSLDPILASAPVSGTVQAKYDSAYTKLRNMYPDGLPQIILENLPATEADAGNQSNGYKTQRYEGVQESSYEQISRYLQLCGCSLVEYSNKAGVLTAVVEKENCQFTFVFDNNEHTVDVTYPGMSHVVKMAFADDPSLAGILPDTSVAFGVFIPRPSVAIGREASDEKTLADGAIQETYSHFSEDDYNTYSTYIQEKSCSVVDYSMTDGVLTIQLEKDGAEFEFVYDKENSQAMITYLSGTRPEVTPSPSPTPKPTPTPAPKTKPATNWQYVMYSAEYQIMTAYNCKKPTVKGVYMLREEEYALIYFEFSFYANGLSQNASLLYKGTKIPGQDDQYDLIGNSPAVYGYTLSDYLKLR